MIDIDFKEFAEFLKGLIGNPHYMSSCVTIAHYYEMPVLQLALYSWNVNPEKVDTMYIDNSHTRNC